MICSILLDFSCVLHDFKFWVRNRNRIYVWFLDWHPTISWNLMWNLKKNLNSTSQTFCFPFCVLEPTKRGEESRNFLEFRDPHKNVRQLTNEHHLTFMCYPSLFLFLSPNLKTKLKLRGVGIFYPFTQLWEVYNLHIDRVWILDSR